MLSFEIFITFCGAAVVCMIAFLFALEREIRSQRNRHSPSLASAHRAGALTVVYSNPARQAAPGRTTAIDFARSGKRTTYREA
jgi:hypothetical protein